MTSRDLPQRVGGKQGHKDTVVYECVDSHSHESSVYFPEASRFIIIDSIQEQA